jgi:hypothetical protein
MRGEHMTRLDPAALWILRAIFGMGGLSLLMVIWMGAVRIPTMGRPGLSVQDAAHTADIHARLPSSARRVVDNYNHLFEAPTVFYAVALAIIVAGIADPVYAVCAWTFLVFRVVHSLVQATINVVSIRFLFFSLSWVALAVMIVRPILLL